MRTYIYVLGQTFTKKRPLVRHIDDYAKERDVVVVQIDDNPCVALNLEIDAGQRLIGAIQLIQAKRPLVIDHTVIIITGRDLL